MITGRGGWAKRCNDSKGDSKRDESIKEQLQCKIVVLIHSS